MTPLGERMTDFGEFIRLGGVTPNRGATDAELAGFEAQTGLTLLPELRRLYAASNGLVVDRRGRMRILPLGEVAGHVRSFGSFGIPVQWGYFPFTDLNDSNPHCVCCDGPAKGYVVHVNHDDVAHIEFRNLDSFLAAVRRVMEAGAETDDDDDAPSLWRLPQDFSPDTSGRTPADVEA